jgi:hypothetical protein
MERDKPKKYDVLQLKCLELVTVHSQTCITYSAREREECKVWIFRQIPPIEADIQPEMHFVRQVKCS